jgi:hypothetical protein
VTLDEIDCRVREADGVAVPLDAFPLVYDAGDRVTLDPVGPVVPEPDDDLVLYLLELRYPGVMFEPADEFPGFREDPVPDHVIPRGVQL